MSNKNKQLGNNAERYFASRFRSMGFKYARTSREVSNIIDGLGIDLVFVPYNIQIKAGIQKSTNFRRTLLYIKNNLKENKIIPPNYPIYRYMNILIHRMVGRRGRKRTDNLDLVYFKEADFYKLIKNSKIKFSFDKIPIYKNISKEKMSLLFTKKKNNYNYWVIEYRSKNKSYEDYRNLIVITFSFFENIITKQNSYESI